MLTKLNIATAKQEQLENLSNHTTILITFAQTKTNEIISLCHLARKRIGQRGDCIWRGKQSDAPCGYQIIDVRKLKL